MKNEFISKGVVGTYRTGAMVGIGIMIWMQSHTVSREDFESWIKSHEKFAESKVIMIEHRLDAQENETKELRRMHVECMSALIRVEGQLNRRVQ